MNHLLTNTHLDPHAKAHLDPNCPQVIKYTPGVFYLNLPPFLTHSLLSKTSLALLTEPLSLFLSSYSCPLIMTRLILECPHGLTTHTDLYSYLPYLLSYLNLLLQRAYRLLKSIFTSRISPHLFFLVLNTYQYRIYFTLL